ncbi:MAG: phosphotransferase family protein [Actinobacteria bacterium]|nr:phosphotransferase family protein [Actinomycetota bacterium]
MQTDGIDVASVTDWFDDHVPGLVPPLDFELIAGGHSNLTYAVTDAADPPNRRVLRRPPLRQVLATAHDMEREHRIIAALGPTDVPVPAAIALCTDEAVNGRPFYVMDFVDGRVIRSTADAAALTPDERRRAGESLVDVLAAIHAVDIDAVGLGDLGRREDYISRQLRRWYSQFQGSDSQLDGALGLTAVHEVHDRLQRSIPTQVGAAIVHGDYRLDNCMLHPDGSVMAVLDWEICTLGDPLADVGLLWVYWSDPDGVAVLPQASPTAFDGFPGKSELIERYARRSGRDLSDLGFYIAFGYWKLTCIIAGVYARYAGGAMGDVSDAEVAGFRAMLDSLSEATAAAAEGID